MLIKTRGIVLHTVRYGDNSLIATLYSEQLGRQSFIVNQVHGTKSKNKAGLLQALFIVEAEAYFKENRELQRIKEIRAVAPYNSISLNVAKSSQLFFLSEVLFKVLQEQEPNPPMYNFIESSLIKFDMLESGFAAFHLYFLSNLTRYLGIFPRIEPISNAWFDLRKGTTVPVQPAHQAYMDPDSTKLFSRLLNIEVNELPQVSVTRGRKEALLNAILYYYHLHFGNLSSVHSIKVLKEVFD